MPVSERNRQFFAVFSDVSGEIVPEMTGFGLRDAVGDALGQAGGLGGAGLLAAEISGFLLRCEVATNLAPP